MFDYSSPLIESIEKTYWEDATVAVKDFDSTLLLSIMKGGDEDEWETIPFDRESRKFIHINLLNIDEKFIEGTANRVKNPPTTITPLKRCTIDNMKTEFEKKYLQVFSMDYYYCMHMDDDLELRNIKDQRYIQESHKFIKLTVEKCTDKKRNIENLDETEKESCIASGNDDCTTVDP